MSNPELRFITFSCCMLAWRGGLYWATASIYECIKKNMLNTTRYTICKSQTGQLVNLSDAVLKKLTTAEFSGWSHCLMCQRPMFWLDVMLTLACINKAGNIRRAKYVC
jgi:hypothetical protein